MSFFISRIPLADLRSRPPLSKQTPLPTIAIRGSPALPHSSSISRGARLGDAAPPTAAIKGWTLASSSPVVIRTCPARSLGLVADRRLELGRPEIGGRRIDEVADERGGIGETDCVVDPRRLAGDKPSRTGLGLVLLRPVGVEPVLPEQPAERRDAGFTQGEPVGAFGEAFAKPGQAPRGERIDVLDAADDLEVAAARQQRKGECGFPSRTFAPREAKVRRGETATDLCTAAARQ